MQYRTIDVELFQSVQCQGGYPQQMQLPIVAQCRVIQPVVLVADRTGVARREHIRIDDQHSVP